MGIKTVVEYEKITRANCTKDSTDQTGFDHVESFDILKKFLLSETTYSTYESLIEFGTNNGKEYIKVKNYVGAILLQNGDVLEILPKIAKDRVDNIEELKQLVIKMINAVPDIHNKSVNSASVGIEKLPIFEAFIRMFIKEVLTIVKYGLKHDYNVVEENLNYYKGKVIFSQNIKYNYSHMERSYSEHDEFNSNRPENKLIKSTLMLLSRLSKDSRNIKDIKTILTYFVDVDESTNYDIDFSRCQKDRNIMNYQNVLSWCKVFLKGKSFSPYAGSKIACVILFPMETLFESYIAKLMRVAAKVKNMKFISQDSRYYIYTEPKLGKIKPDIVLIDKYKRIYIVDTKWKLIDDKEISKSDIHQMFAYQHKYSSNNKMDDNTSSCKSVTLLYPGEEKFSKYKDSNDSSELNIAKINLLSRKNGLENLLNRIVV